MDETVSGILLLVVLIGGLGAVVVWVFEYFDV